MNSVCFSPISVQPLSVLVHCWSKIEEFFNQMAISLSEFQRRILLSEKTDLLQCLSSDFKITLFRFRCRLISSALSLMLNSRVPKVPLYCPTPFGRLSASLEFRHTLVPPLYPCYISIHSVENTISEGVLSLCGCFLTLTPSPPQ